MAFPPLSQIFKYLICLAAGFASGWFAFGGMQIAILKAGNHRLLAKDVERLIFCRQQIQAYHKKNGHFPADVKSLVDSNFLSASDMPVEVFKASSRWVSQWDGQGGFIYQAADGKLYLNADIKRMKFFWSDWRVIFGNDFFPKGSVY